jgi:uncharacterized protein (TIGR04255 family)
MVPKLASYTNPPIVESVLGVEFSEPIKGWNLGHYGMFWQRVREKYPTLEVNQPLTDESGLFLTAEPILPRCWYVAPASDRLVQIQPDRFIVNWRRRPQGANEEYPHYPANRDIFLTEWNAFTDFLASEKLTLPAVKRCEVTYVNQIDQGQGWENSGDLEDVFTCWKGKSDDPLFSRPEHVSFNLAYMVHERVVLNCQLSPTIRIDTGKQSLRFNLTAKVEPQPEVTGTVEGILSALDECRYAVVKGFESLTTVPIQQFWGKTL